MLTRDAESPDLAPWTGELLQSTSRLSLSVVVASPRSGSHTLAAGAAARIIKAVSQVTPGGSGNFPLRGHRLCRSRDAILRPPRDWTGASGQLEDPRLAQRATGSALAVKWNKPLSARLFPIPGGEAGDMTSFNDPALTNCRILPLGER